MTRISLLRLLAVLPLIGAFIARSLPSAPASVDAAAPHSSLAFDQYLVNLRQAPLQPLLWGDYQFTNVGDTPLTIRELDPSCECLQPQLAGDKQTYQPGERGLFRVQVATANEPPGPQSYTITVKYTDPEPHEAIVRFKATLPERKITVNPPELAFFQYNGEPASRVIHLTDYRGDGLEVLKAVCSSDVVTLNVLEADRDEAGHHRIPIELSVPGIVPAGRQVTTVTVTTNDPEFAAIRIPVLVDGPAQPASPVQLIGHEQPSPLKEDPASGTDE